MSDPTDQDKNEEKKGRPDLKIVSINENILEMEEEDLQKQLVQLYAYTREMFLNIEDYDQQVEAVNYLRTAFLTALNPLQGIDSKFQEWLEEEEDE